jgi:hypothetical protein
MTAAVIPVIHIIPVIFTGHVASWSAYSQQQVIDFHDNTAVLLCFQDDKKGTDGRYVEALLHIANLFKLYYT